MFDDLRSLTRVTMRALHVGGRSGIGEGGALFVLGGGIVWLGTIVALGFSLYRRRRGTVAQEPGPTS